jgi:hypothetical protein
MDECQSIEFLCRQDNECEQEDVCCISEGMLYGICNPGHKCKSVELFARYISKKTMSEEPSAVYDPGNIIVAEIFLTLALIISFILVMRSWKNK